MPASTDDSRVTLVLDPAAIAASEDALRSQAIKKFRASCPALATPEGKPQRFVVCVTDLLEFVKRGHVAWDGMADELRFMRLYLLLLSNRTDVLQNYLASGRFVGKESLFGASRQQLIDGAVKRLLLFNAWGDGASAHGAAQLEVLQQLSAKPRPVPSWWRKVQAVLSSPIVPLAIAWVIIQTAASYLPSAPQEELAQAAEPEPSTEAY